MDDLENSGPVYVAPVRQESIVPILRAETSEWYWIMLPDGDRMVGFFPHEEGSEYWHDEDHRTLDWKHINHIELYGCDVCDKLVPEDEIRHSQGIDNGQGDTSQCHACIDDYHREMFGGARRAPKRA